MKSKPVKHKTTNTFRFIPFAERINAIDIRHAALYHIEHANTEQPEDNETHFHVGLRKWNALNLTENFKKFRKEVFGVITLPQLLHRKDEVLSALEKYLELQDEACLQPLLELLVALAKDLREDFYQDFPRFLDILIKLLDTKNAERLEWTLVCLAFLFKILKPYLKRDLASVLRRIVPLLSDARPQYINNFAAESFAFVARDIRDKKKFINLVVSYLQSHEDAINGCGHLLFEMMKGVPGKFHSCFEAFMPLLLQHLKENKDHQDILFNVLTQTIEDCLQSIDHKEFGIFWSCIIKYTEEILQENDEESKGLEYILRLAGQAAERDGGRFLLEPPQLVLLLVRVICEQAAERVLAVCARIGALLLTACGGRLAQEHAAVVARVLLPLPYPNILLNFVSDVIDYAQFDLHILPHFLTFVVNSAFAGEALRTLAAICLRRAPLAGCGAQLFEWVKYPLDFGRALPLFEAHCARALERPGLAEHPEGLFSLLVILPHVERLPGSAWLPRLRALAAAALTALVACNLEGQRPPAAAEAARARRLLVVVGGVVECAAHLSQCKHVSEVAEPDTLLLSLLPAAAPAAPAAPAPATAPAALRALDLYLTALQHERALSLPQLSLVDSYLRDNLMSPFHVVRLLTTHIYKLFENVEEMKKSTQIGGSTETLEVFSLCYSVEATPPSIQQYRGQLAALRRLAAGGAQHQLLRETSLPHVALSYLLGVLYLNFQLLWEPVTELVAGHGQALPADDFWPTFLRALEFAFANANGDLKSLTFDDEMGAGADGPEREAYAAYCSASERPDLANYRILLLKAMAGCMQVCEARNRDVVVLFLDFIDTQYRNNKKMNALVVDVGRHGAAAAGEPGAGEAALALEEDEKETVSGKNIFKTLINIMQVLSKFKNPRALYREPDFWNLYMEFLMNKNPGLQKYALECVLNYKNKSVTPYKDNLSNLVDDKKFKDELTQFKLTEDSESIRAEDRQHVMPLVLRILYGKMTAKLGADKKAGGGQARRALVLRHLAGCPQPELKMFIDMAFSHLASYFAMSPREIYDGTVASLDLQAVTSPGKLHSILNLFEVVREHIGGYMEHELLAHFFKIFYAVSSIVATVLAREDKVHVGFLKAMKNLRTLLLTSLRKIFDSFHKYEWSKEELSVVFETLVWPLLARLPTEGVHSPTQLLKLLSSWCQNPRYYTLLITCSENDSVSAIPAIFELLINSKTNPVVSNMILDMVEKLLTLTEDEQNEEDEARAPPLPTLNTLAVSSEATVNINFGSKILLPHIPSILEVMKRRFANSAKSNTVNKRDLLILARVTELVASPELCDELLGLLLPILVRKVCLNMAEDNMEYAVTTIINLLSHSTKPQLYIKNISVLFNKVNQVEVRKLLLMALASVAERASEGREALARLARLVAEMNAYNQRWIEQPDFDRRLDAYKEIYTLSESDVIDLDLAVLIVNNCFYSIRTERDIGLRDSAALCLKRILPRLLMKHRSAKDGEFLVRDTVLALISGAIRDTKHELVRHEAVALLGELARESPAADPVLADLAPLACKEDAEVDFFENMCHLQMHRRVRALQKFSKVFKKVVKCPTPRTLTNFILPLASTYLCDDKYTDKNTLIDASIEAVATCCRLLPWHHYEVILRLYLTKLRRAADHQKQLTRILVGIVDAFHFDFSKAKNIDLPKALINNMQIGNTGRRKKVEKGSADDNRVEVSEENTAKIRTDIAVTPDKNKTNENGEATAACGDDLEDNAGAKEEQMDLNEELKLADEAEAAEAEEAEAAEAEEAAVEETPEVAPAAPAAPAFERVTSVAPSVARRIVKSLASGLLPQLNRAIGKMTGHEAAHALQRRGGGLQRAQEELQRVPLALALVKLLQRLPPPLLAHHLPAVFVKLCSFLKSPLKQVRLAARDVVKRVMVTVGSSYLRVLLEHLTLLLTRGFQVHALVATLHAVLDALKADLQPGEVDDSLVHILDVCTSDLFGALAEEKEVDKLQYRTPEAKPSKKTYVTLTIVAQNVTERCLVDLLLPFKEVLQEHHSKKMVLKVQEALAHLAAGLVTNSHVGVEALFVFLHGVASESIPEFVLGAPRRETTAAQSQRMRAQPDCFIVPGAPARSREVQARLVRGSARANAHVLVEFSLNMLYVTLKRERASRAESAAFVDPLVPLLAGAAAGGHVRAATAAVKCVSALWSTRVRTPALEAHTQGIVKTLFSILHKYATFEVSKQNDNYHLVRIAFKAVTALIRHVKYHTLEEEQLKTLLLYAEQDLVCEERQTSSFSLLKAILEARLVCPQLHEVMDKVARVCILSESNKAREEARALFGAYLGGYGLAARAQRRHLRYCAAQLRHELAPGRQSALLLLGGLVRRMPPPQLRAQAAWLLLALAPSVAADPAPELRAQAAAVAEALLARLDGAARDALHDLATSFFDSHEPQHWELGAQLCTRFVNTEREDYRRRLPAALPALAARLLRLRGQQDSDHCLIQTLNLLETILAQCPASLACHAELDDIARLCQALLAHDHAWVRLRAARVIQHVLRTVTASEIDDALRGGASERSFLLDDPEGSIRSLVLDACAQLAPGVDREMAEQVCALLLQILQLVYAAPGLGLARRGTAGTGGTGGTAGTAGGRGDHEVSDDTKVTVRWILYKTRRAINAEVARAPTTTNIRTSVFTCWLHVISHLEPADLATIVGVLVPPLARELGTADPGAAPRLLAARLGKKLRRRLGDVEYGRLLAAAQARLEARRALRKKALLQERVLAPARAAKRKLQLKDKKKLAKKAKMEAVKGRRKRPAKRRADDQDLEDQLLRDD